MAVVKPVYGTVYYVEKNLRWHPERYPTVMCLRQFRHELLLDSTVQSSHLGGYHYLLCMAYPDFATNNRHVMAWAFEARKKDHWIALSVQQIEAPPTAEQSYYNDYATVSEISLTRGRRQRIITANWGSAPVPTSTWIDEEPAQEEPAESFPAEVAEAWGVALGVPAWQLPATPPRQQTVEVFPPPLYNQQAIQEAEADIDNLLREIEAEEDEDGDIADL